MTSRHAYLWPLLSILIILMLPGCLSTTDGLHTESMLGTKHLYKESQLAWQNAATRQNDLLGKHKLQIFAGVSWKKRTDETTYQLINLRIGPVTDHDDQYTLDLLSPHFSQKMACGWYCEYLDQPILQPALGPYTMLDKTFENQKADLLNFYRGLNQLNQHLNTLDDGLEALMPEIFADLTRTSQSFNSLAHIIGFLNDYFDDIDFDSLLASQALLASEGSENDNMAIGLSPIANVLSRDSPQQRSLDPEAELLANFSPELTLSEMLNSASKPWQHRFFVDNTTKKDKTKVWTNNNNLLDYETDLSGHNRGEPTNFKALQPKQAMLNLGQFACSYEGNYFGIVTAINNETVSLKLNGQVMQIKDGLMVGAKDGLLFSTNTEFSYFPLDSDKDFKQNQLQPCYLNGF
jgi:hypothetical protein